MSLDLGFACVCGQTARLGQKAPQIFIYQPSGDSPSDAFYLHIVAREGEKYQARILRWSSTVGTTFLSFYPCLYT